MMPMRVALISDIHGNVVALDTVLADIARESIDHLICLGDIATLGSQPREVIARLRSLDCQFISGNHETDVLDVPAMMRREGVHPVVAEAVSWCAGQLSGEELDFLRDFRPTLEVDLGGDLSMLCFHGSPKSNTDVILATTPEEELSSLFRGCQESILVGGHTHIPLLRRHRGQLIVNPGSVGEPLLQMPPRDLPNIPPWAEYAIISAEGARVSVDHRRVPVDLDSIRRASAASGNPFNWADLWLERDKLGTFNF